MSKSLIAACLASIVLATGPAFADPVATVPPMAPNIPKALIAQQAKMVPDAADVPLPAYPNSYFISSMGKAGVDLSAVVLVSNDPPEKVKAWYAAHLPNMKYFPKWHAFGSPDLDKGTFADMLSRPHVTIRPQKPEGMLIHFAHLPDVKTKIFIDFPPAKAK